MIEASFSLCDPLNPGCGYQLKITKGRAQSVGEPPPLLFTTVAPDDGSDLLTAADCVRVINMYLPAPWTTHGLRIDPEGADQAI